VTAGAAVALVTAATLLIAALAAGAGPARGERVFQRCYACHSVVAGEHTLPGPNLRGVLGRRAGTLPGFPYSPAMVEAGARGLVWTRTALDAYLADPEAYVPGTQMGMPPLIEPDDRRDVIDYLEQDGAEPLRGRLDSAPYIRYSPVTESVRITAPARSPVGRCSQKRNVRTVTRDPASSPARVVRACRGWLRRRGGRGGGGWLSCWC
jgi:cytochrome c